MKSTLVCKNSCSVIGIQVKLIPLFPAIFCAEYVCTVAAPRFACTTNAWNGWSRDEWRFCTTSNGWNGNATLWHATHGPLLIGTPTSEIIFSRIHCLLLKVNSVLCFREEIDWYSELVPRHCICCNVYFSQNSVVNSRASFFSSEGWAKWIICFRQIGLWNLLWLWHLNRCFSFIAVITFCFC
jgi:hypothetical protein